MTLDPISRPRIGRDRNVQWRTICCVHEMGNQSALLAANLRNPQKANPESQHPMEQDLTPYSPTISVAAQETLKTRAKQHRGPLLYFALGGILGAASAIPLVVPKSLAVEDDPNPIGYLLILFSFPVGGLIYRIRSRRWPIDGTVRQRQVVACCATLLLPIAVAFLTGMRAQGLGMTLLSGIVSMVLMAGIFLSGQRRGRNME